MADSWEDEADSLQTAASLVPAPAALKTDRWEGEDADDVPDAWDAEPAAPSTAAASTVEKKPAAAAAAKPKKGKKGLAEAAERKNAEAEERRRLAAAAAASEDGAVAVPAPVSGLSAEELRRIQEESDLLIAQDTFGVNDLPPAAGAAAPAVDADKSIDRLQPTSKEDFDRLGALLAAKLRGLAASGHYAGFVEALYRDCATELDPDCLRRLSATFTALAAEKQKMQKAAKAKAKPKAKGTLKVERDPAAVGGEGGYDDQYDEFDDFM